ncbi:MAG: hypothetical protein JW909_03260 [Planctomycetes bacterium]|nr:hypothetical protein [Planctomycetota bacterium]
MLRLGMVAGLAACMATAGCGPEYWGPAIGPGQTAESLAGILESRRGSDQVISSKLTLSIRGRVGKISLSHKLRGTGVFTGDKARAIFKKGPISALNILAVEDHLTVYLPWNEKAYRGDVVKYLVGKGSVPEGFHLEPLTFFMPVMKGETKLFDAGGKHHVVETDLGGGFRMRYIVLAATGVIIISDFIHPDGTVILRKEYARYMEVDGMPVPKLVKFAAPRGGVRGYLELGKVDLAPKVRNSVFQIRIPEGIQVEEMEDGKGNGTGGGSGEAPSADEAAEEAGE